MNAPVLTDSTTGARNHARAQAAMAQLAVPPMPTGVAESKVTWAERIPAESYATKILGRGTKVRLTDRDGDACLHLLLLRAGAEWERLNPADTVKVPWQAYLGLGHPLLSDQGRVLATMVADTSIHHDALCGSTVQGRALFTRAAAKQGLTPRDIGPTVSFFRGVRVAPDGALEATGSAGAGAYVELIVHLPVVVLAVNSAHPLDTTPTTAVEVVAWGAADELHTLPNTDPEYLRAVQNTERAWGAAQNWSEQP